MGYPPSYNDTSCPQSVSTINVTQTVINIADGSAQIRNEAFDADDLDVTNKILTLGFTPCAGFAPEVHVGGVEQQDAVIVGDTVTFPEALNDDDVITVRYAYEV